MDLDLVPWHEGNEADCLAIPLGGLGTGTVAMCGDGTLRQWQLNGPGNHSGFVPDSFLALRSSRPGSSDVLRVLEAVPPAADRSAPLTSDGRVPEGIRARHRVLPPFSSARIRAAYPAAEVELHDDAVPVEVRVRALNPLVPLRVDLSSLPVAMFEVILHNPSNDVLTGWLAASAQNQTGWDGITPIDGNRNRGYGGAVNRVRRSRDSTAVVMGNAALPSDDPGYGQLVLALDSPDTRVVEHYASTDEFAAFLRGCYLIDHELDGRPGAATGTVPLGRSAGPSPGGATWSCGLAAPYRLEPGETRRVRAWLTWWFPNRHVDFVQFGTPAPDPGPVRLGAHYAERFPDAVAVSDLIAREWDQLVGATSQWIDTHRGLDPLDAEHLLAQAAPLRSPTCFRTPDGRFFGFEGVQGASTGGWADYGGSCPLNCTHVWNYEQCLARLFPSLELTMRETEFDVMRLSGGALSHRVRLPISARQPSLTIGGPVAPALDGMIGTVLKCLREVQQGAGIDWLRRRWPDIVQLMSHIEVNWDRGDGVLTGPQPSTFDIPLHGVNPYIGVLWLAGLRAHQRLAHLVGETKTAAEAQQKWLSASAAYDELTFNGEYFEQRLSPGDPDEGSWGTGCHTDQLLGQWWAHQLGLGHVLPADHVRTALRSILKYNYLSSFEHGPSASRVFADLDDAGLVNCSWPRGGRPPSPVWYCDEVWTGSELQVAAHLAFEGMCDESRQVRQAVWHRYDGSRRNPFNHIECGDHYVRSMAGFSLLSALSGVRYDASADGLIDHGGSDGRYPLADGGRWGVVTREEGRLRFTQRS